MYEGRSVTLKHTLAPASPLVPVWPCLLDALLLRLCLLHATGALASYEIEK